MDIPDDLIDLAEAYVWPNVDELYRRLMERDNVQDDIEVVMLTAALTNILGHDNRGDHPTEVLLMSAWGQQGVLDSSSVRFMRSRNGALSGSDLAKEPGLGTIRPEKFGKMYVIHIIEDIFGAVQRKNLLFWKMINSVVC